MARSRRDRTGERSGPVGSVDLPDLPDTHIPQLGPEAAFAALDARLPLALLPLRIETRFFLDQQPRELRVRFFPDVVHADGHARGLTAVEQQLGRAFWERSWRAGRDGTAAKDAAFAALQGRVGAWRAAWVARQTAPANPDAAPADPVPDGQPLKPAPRFRELPPRTGSDAARARLLPLQLGVVGYYDEESVGTWWGQPIPDDVAVAPGLVDAQADLDGRAWLEAQGLSWTFDFDEAERIGMAVRIDLDKIDQPVATEGFGELIVVGVGAGERHGALEELLDAHRYTRGLDFVGQGTPTNVTETAAPSLDLANPGPAAVRASELDAEPHADRPAIDEDGGLFRLAAADAASVALGLGGANALDRSGHSALAELSHAEAMNRALWPALGGHYLDQLLQGAVTDAGRGWVRDWSTRYVRGGGPLPTLLVGSQPYGLLPVALLEQLSDPTNKVQEVQDVLVNYLAGIWRSSLSNVPVLDPDATDAPPQSETSGEQAALVSRILGAVPHPTAFRLRRVDGMRSTYTTEYGGRLLLLALGLGTMPGPDAFPYPSLDDNPAWALYENLKASLDAATGVAEQLLALQRFTTDLEHLTQNPVQEEHLTPELYDIADGLVALVQAHSDRTAPAAFISLRRPEITRMMGDDDDPSAFFDYHADTQVDWQEALVAPSRSEADLEALREWLTELRDQVEDGGAKSYDYSQPLPLLRQLLQWSAENATGPGDLAVLAGTRARGGLPRGRQVPLPPAGPAQQGAIAALLEIANREDDPVGELERLLRETLGTWSYRLDAWYTAVAAARLENKRQAAPRGIQVGAFGWLVDVKPRPADASQGYVLAPSLAHATTAAILRSGWNAFGGAGASGALAVDLRSDRVRRARWIVDGVRQGQDLALLLGARFERSLQDAHQDRWIDDFRQLALTAAGSPGAPTAVVDGLLLARAWSGADDLSASESAALAAITALLAGDAAADRGDLEQALRSLASDLDAVADAALAQSVFSLAEGNVSEATATLTASATGEVTFPNLRVTETPRPALTVTHRLLCFVDPGAAGSWSGSATSGRALAAPGLEAWLSGLLGDPASVTLTVRFDDPATGATAAAVEGGTLADVGLSALDLIYLSPVGEDTGLGQLGAVLEAWANGRRPAGVPASAVATVAADAGDPSLDDLLLAARSLRGLVTESRDLDGRDLASPGATDVAASFDTDELAARVDRVRAALAAGRDVLAAALPESQGATPRGDVHTAMLGLLGFQLSGGVPSALDDDGLVAEGQGLIARIDARLADYDAEVAASAAGWATLDELTKHAALGDRVRRLVGHALPLAPLVRPANAADLQATFGRGRLRSREAATGWLAAAGRVDPGAGRLRVAVDLVEAAREAVLFDFSLGQLPDREGEGWAALERPEADDRGRLCLLGVGGRPVFDGAPVAGLVVTAWTESIPRQGQTAGIAVQFDAPSARPPQAILLCTAEPGPGFSFDLVRDTVMQTLSLSCLRMVGPETLEELGQYLPAAYLHVDTAAGGTG